MNKLYSLTPQEEAIAVEVGYQRQKPYLGDPTRNVNYSEGSKDKINPEALTGPNQRKIIIPNLINLKLEDAKERQIKRLEEKLQLKNEVISELMEENVKAKKENGDL